MSKIILWIAGFFDKTSTYQAIVISLICALAVGAFVFGYLKNDSINDITNAAIKAETGIDLESAQHKTDDLK